MPISKSTTTKYFGGVIFDTNAYRNITFDKTRQEAIDLGRELRVAERQHSISAYAQIFVMAELLSHLADPDDGAFENCRNAITCMWHHCKKVASDGTRGVRLLAAPETQMARSFYGVEIEDHLVKHGQFMRLVREVANRGSNANLDDIEPGLTDVAESVERVKTNFALDVASVVGRTDEGAKSWQFFKDNPEMRKLILDFTRSDDALKAIARMHVIKAQNMTEASDTADEINKKSEALVNTFPTSLEMYRGILEKLALNEYNMNRRDRKNSILDMHIAFFVGDEARIGGEPMALVTDDNGIIQAAADAGMEPYVMGLEAYRTAVSA